MGGRLIQRPRGIGPDRHRQGAGIAVRVAQRLLAMTAAIWYNHKTGQPTTRSLIAYDH